MLRSKRDLKLLSTQIQHEPNLVGTWVNELGSRMRIDSVDDGLITGNVLEQSQRRERAGLR